MLLTSWLAARPSRLRRRPRPAAPSATERLEDRTLLAGTPLSLSAVADGDVTDDGMNGTWDAVDTTSSTVMTWRSPPFTGWVGREDRGVHEFNVAPAAAGVLESASLSLSVNTATYSAGQTLRISVYAYAGDGAVTAADATRTATKVGELAVEGNSEILGPKTVTLDAAALQPLVAAGGHLGLLTVLTSTTANQFAVWSSESFDPADHPKLDLVVNRSTVTVDTLVDENDGNYAAGDLSLREAIAIADAGATITFASALTGTITLGSQLTLSRDVTIAGLGASRLTVSGNNASRVFQVGSGVEAEIRGLTISSGRAATSDGGGILNLGDLTLSGVVMSGNVADYGGAIYNIGQLTILGSRFEANQATSSAGAIFAGGFGTSTVVRNTTFEANKSTWGAGAVFNGDGSLTVESSAFIRNESSPIHGNGGAINNNGAGTLVLTNSTVSGNKSNSGGGIITAGNTTIRNSTIVENTAVGGGGIDIFSGGGPSTVTIANSIVAANNGSSSPSDISGAVASLGNNLIGNTAGAGGFVASDLLNQAPRLAPLADNGGPTKTHALLADSPARDAGSNAQALGPGGAALAADARGVARILGSAVDIGAYEALASAVVDLLADEDDGNYAAGDLSLREAIKIVAPGGTVTFAAPLAGKTITLGGTRIDVAGSLTVAGPGVTISGNDASQIFHVAAGASLSLVGLTLTRGNAAFGIETQDGGAIHNKGTVALTNVTITDSTAAFRGAAIFNVGTVTMTGGAIRRSSGSEAVENAPIGATAGTFTASGVVFADNAAGAIHNWGTVVVDACAFERNSAAVGSAIDNFGTGASVTVTRSSFVGNKATSSGGAIKHQGHTFRIADSVFSGNTAGNAAAIMNFSGAMEVTGSVFFGNVATSFHGGVFDTSGDLRVSNSTFSANQAPWNGGAVYAWAGSATFRNVTITGNRVNVDGSANSFEDGAGIYQHGQAVVTLYNSIVAGNFLGGSGLAEDIHGSVSGSHNVVGSAGAAGGLTPATYNHIGVSAAAVLDPVLRNNGGPTLTHALVAGSVAVNAGSNAQALDAASPGSPLATDQRGAGFSRIVNGTVDIGAVEAPKPTSVVVDISDDEDDGNYAAGDISLREAVSLVATGGTITFAASLAGETIVLGGTEIALNRDVTITGLGVSLLTLSGNDASRVFRIDTGASVALSRLSLVSGKVTGVGGAIENRGTLALSNSSVRESSAGDGGAIFNASGAVLSLDTTEFSANRAGNGGGAVFNSGRLIATDCIFTANTAYFGGAIFNGGEGTGYDADGTVIWHSDGGEITLSRSTVSDNTAVRWGGGIINHWKLTVERSILARNTANRVGGGIFNNASMLSIADSQILENEALGFDDGSGLFGGGGICSTNGFTMTRTTVAGNEALIGGGGVWSDGNFAVISDSTFSGNSAQGGGAIYANRLTLTNSTISGNVAEVGGGIHGGDVTIRNSTIVGNRADRDGAGGGRVGGGLDARYGTWTLFNTIVAGNVVGAGAGTANDIVGTLAGASSHNLIGDAATAGGLLPGVNGNIIGVDWTTVLDPVLRDNGGPTRTHALLVGSIAVNSGSNAAATAPEGTPLSSDQRGPGFPRIVGGTVDIGAFEAPNSNPVVRPDAVSTGESAILVHSLFLDNGSGFDADPDRNPLTVTAVNGSSADVGAVVTLASGAKLVVNANGTFLFDPNGKFEGLAAGATATYSFTYTVSDGYGGSATATATVTIIGENDPPVARNDAMTVGEDVPASLSPLGNDSDPDAGHAFSLLSVDTTGLQGTVTVGPNGTLTYDPGLAFGHLAAGQTATETFTYTVADEHGATSTATVTVTITGANDAPTAVGDAIQVGEDGPLAAGPLANDSDPDGDTLSVAAVNGAPVTAGQIVTLPSGARVTVNADGTLKYDPNGKFDSLKTGQTAADSFTYTVSDGNGGTSTATVAVTIHGANDAPTAPSRSTRTNEHRAASGNLLAGAADAEGDPLTIAAVNGSPANAGTTIPLASGARLTVNPDGSYTYDPNGAFVRLRRGETRTDSFTYTISDGNGGTTTVTETVTIEGGGNEADLIANLAGEWYVAAGNGSSFATALAAKWANAAWSALKTGDFDGDGRTDVLGLLAGEWYVGLARTTPAGLATFVTTRWAKWNNVAWEHALVGDVDGDGRDDVVAEIGGQWYGATSTGAGFAPAKLLARTSDAAWNLASLADVTGDGKDDLVVVLNGDWYVAPSTGAAFGSATRWARMGAGPYQLLTLADLNADGRLDAVGFAGGEWRVGTSNGTSAFALALRAKWASATWLDPLVGDFDGDGAADLAARYGGHWYVGLSNASGGERSRALWASWGNVAWKDVRVADFDGDGRADLAARFNGEWYVARSTGAAASTALWARWKEAAWNAVAAADADGFVPPLASPPAGLRLALPSAAPAVPLSDDEPLTLFWSQADEDKDFAARLAAV